MHTMAFEDVPEDFRRLSREFQRGFRNVAEAPGSPPNPLEYLCNAQGNPETNWNSSGFP